jgi:hypothetical protein
MSCSGSPIRPGPKRPGQPDVAPFWLERQTDLEGPDFIPSPVDRPVENLTHRSWTMVGTIATVDRGVVDPRGLVTPGDGGWSLDWWVGADDRWHTPATEAGVRQRLVDDAPVVETVMRIPGGDAVQRVYAIHATNDSPFGQAFVVVEVENCSSVPFAIAFAVLPANPIGEVPITTLALDGTTVLVNGSPGLLLAKPPARAAANAGHVAGIVLGGQAPSSFDSLLAPDGNGEAVVIFPLAHTATIRVVLPLGVAVPAGRARSRRASVAPMRYPSAVPSAEQVAAGWEVQTRRGPRFTLPDPALQTTLDAGRRLLVLAHGGEDLAGWPRRPIDWVEAASVLGALDRFGFHDEAEQVLATIGERQALDGSLVGERGGLAANGAALTALGEHWRLCRDDALIEQLVGPVAKAIHWIEKRRTARRSVARLSSTDLEWSIRGLGLIADALDSIGQPDVAVDARQFATAARDQLTDEQGDEALDQLDGGPDEVADASAEDLTVALADPVARAGLSPQRTLAQARVELLAGDPMALERLAWVRSVASPTHVWPEVVHPRTSGGSRGDGHHSATGADVLSFIRDLLVRETDGGLALCSVLPSAWLGQGFEVHDAPTAWGRLSYAVRWHGERPALLWELDPHPGQPTARLTAPGLDLSWQSDDLRGDALLGVPAGAADVPSLGSSFS